MSDAKKPEIEFPCQYPIKVLGDAHTELNQHVVDVMNTHAPKITESDLNIKNSSKGKWQSITVTITATGKPQLDAIFADLKTSARVKMVL
ncbi:MAG: YbeD family protein [Porticoccaceae bacterium]